MMFLFRFSTVFIVLQLLFIQLHAFHTLNFKVLKTSTTFKEPLILSRPMASTVFGIHKSVRFQNMVKPLATYIIGLLSGVVASTLYHLFKTSFFETAEDIPSHFLKKNKTIRGKVVKVVDGDTYLIRHMPVVPFAATEFHKPTEHNTITIRILAVDTPETAKFGNKGQKGGDEAKVFATEKLLGKEVSLKLFARDQYKRVVASVSFNDGKGGIFSKKKDISEELLKEGLAVVYRQGGGQYDGGIEKWEQLEREAIAKRKGIWVDGEKAVELPSDYKKQIKNDT